MLTIITEITLQQFCENAETKHSLSNSAEALLSALDEAKKVLKDDFENLGSALENLQKADLNAAAACRQAWDDVKVQKLEDANADVWEVPYLPIDPGDIGRTFEAIIRVNSQSGKAGSAYLLEADHHVRLPRGAEIEFSSIVQDEADETGKEITNSTQLLMAKGILSVRAVGNIITIMVKQPFANND